MTKPKLPSQLRGKSSTLSVQDVQRIRQIGAARSQTPREISLFYGVGTETIRRILRRETWNDIPESTFSSEEELREAAAESAERMSRMITAAKERAAAGPRIVEELAALPASSIEDKARAFGASVKTAVIQPVEEGEHDAGYE